MATRPLAKTIGKRFDNWTGSTKSCIALYTVLFALTMAFALLPLAVYSKTFLCYLDSTVQDYAFFAYYGHWLRDVLYQLFVAHGDVSTWSQFYGYGEDLWPNLSTFLLPSSLLAAIVPTPYAEPVYNAVLVLRFYVSGLLFFWYARLRGRERGQSLFGSLCYVFAGTFVVVFTHTSFVLSLVVFPMILVGMELVMRGRNPLLFVYGICLASRSAQSMLLFTLFAGVYYIYRIFFSSDAPAAFERRRVALRVAGYAVLGLLLSCLFLFPMVMNNMVGMERLGLERSVPLLYAGETYISFYRGIVGAEVLPADGYWGFGPLFLSALVLLALRWRKHKALALLMVSILAFALLPSLSSALNAFQYPNLRWFWMPAFAGAWITMEMLYGGRLTGRESKALVVSAIVYGAVALLLPGGQAPSSFWVMYAFALLGVGILVAPLLKPPVPGIVNACLIALACVGGAANTATYLAPGYGDNLTMLDEPGEAYEMMAYSAPSALGKLNEDYHGLQVEEGDLWRYDDAVSHPNNANLFSERMGIDFYSSLYRNEVDDFHQSLALNNPSAVYYLGLNGRSTLEALLGVRYFIAPENCSSVIVPAQFDELAYPYYSWDVLTTDHWLPLAFGLSEVLPRSEWDGLSPIERQAALLGAAVIENEDVDSLGAFELDGASSLESLGAPSSLPYTVTSPVDEPTDEERERAEAKGEKVAVPQTYRPGDEIGYVSLAQDGKGFTVRSGGSRVHLSFDAPAGSEVYVVFENLRYTPLSSRETYTDEEWEEASGYTKATVSWESLVSTPAQVANVWSRSLGSDAWSCAQVYDSSQFMYAGHHDFALNLGCSNEPTDGAVLEFSKAGTYTFDSLTVWVQPLDRLDDVVDGLRAASPSDFSYANGVISGSIDMDSDGLLFLSVAYSDGWSATVDGQPADVLRADVAFMAVPVSEGSHTFELRYSTPHAFEGLVVSGVSAAVLAALLVRRRVRMRR